MLMARLRGIDAISAAREYLASLPSDHSLLNDQMARMEFQCKIHEAEKKYELELKATHS